MERIGLLAFNSVPPLIEVSTEFAANPYLFILQSAETTSLFSAAEKLTYAMYGMPELRGVNSNLYIKNPETFIDIDRDKSDSLGVTAEDIESTAYSFYGSREISNIYATTDTYKVVIQVGKSDQLYPDELSSLLS